MSYSGSTNSGPPPFDPWLQPELFRGVLTRRAIAFLIDLVVLSIPVVLVCVFIAVFGARHAGARLGAVLAAMSPAVA